MLNINRSPVAPILHLMPAIVEARALLNQRTIKRPVTLKGVGLHSGLDAKVTIHPAPANTGVVFLAGGSRIKASYENVADTSYATTLRSGEVKAATVEHLLAALSGLRIDNAYIELYGSEVPILDGSALPFVQALKAAGLAVLDAPRKYMKIIKAVTVHEGDKSASFLPSPAPRITCRIDFDRPPISDQSRSVDVDPGFFERELAPARTFGFMHEVEMLRRMGLARGGSLDNAVVVDGERVLNEEGLRFPDEFVRHKMLDIVGDVSLAGMPVIAHIVADKSGHELNQRLLREVFARPDCWIVVEGEPEYTEAPAIYAEALP